MAKISRGKQRRLKELQQKVAKKQTYADYVKLYNNRQKRYRKEGLEMQMPKYTEAQWKIQKRIMLEEQPNVTDINHALVDRAAYARSEAQSMSYKKAIKEISPEADVRLRDVMVGRAEALVSQLRAHLAQTNAKLIDDGYDRGSDRAAIIGAMYFGSI